MSGTYHIKEEQLYHYTSRRVNTPVTIDGNLEKSVWQSAEKSRPFVDLVSGEAAFLETRIASLWDDDNLYIAFWIAEPQVRARITQRDSFIWFENDVEVFIAGEDCYYEFEMNALNTIYEVLFIYQDALKRGSRFFDMPEFDLYTRDVDVLSGFQDAGRWGKHHRGKRWAFMDYDFPGLKTAVKIDGSLNEARQCGKGWTAELAFPWAGIQKMFARQSFPPREGDTLRVQFFRFESLHFHGKTHPESVGWSLNEHGVYDSHIPENFPYLHFAR